MAQYRKKPVVIEAITFNEFVEYAKSTTNEPHWSIPYKGIKITHENDECYLVPTMEGVHRFTPIDMLITGVIGESYVCKVDVFNQTYEKVEVKQYIHEDFK